MSSLKNLILSGAKFPGAENTVERINIGRPGDPSELIVYNGKIWVYDSTGQALIDGGYISADALSAVVITAEKLTLSNQKYIDNIEFTPVDENTCSWSAGVIIFADGTQVNIEAGTTGNLTQTNYIYFDGTTVLKKTQYPATAQSASNIPLAIVTPVEADIGKCFVAPMLPKGTTIDGDVIATGRISSVNGKTYFDLDDGILMVNDTVNDRVLIGKIGASYGIKVSLPGYEVDTETNLDNFALWSLASDSNDNVLIKEKTRGSVSVGAYDHEEVAHGLSYIPFCLCFVEESTGIYTKAYGQPIDERGFYFQVDDTNLTFWNSTATARTFKYYIFYDQMSA
jgi:hypothetical protein